RWTSQDPLGFSAGDDNLYRYVSNNPTNATDPFGTETWVYESTRGKFSFHWGALDYQYAWTGGGAPSITGISLTTYVTNPGLRPYKDQNDAWMFPPIRTWTNEQEVPGQSPRVLGQIRVSGENWPAGTDTFELTLNISMFASGGANIGGTWYGPRDEPLLGLKLEGNNFRGWSKRVTEVAV